MDDQKVISLILVIMPIGGTVSFAAFWSFMFPMKNCIPFRETRKINLWLGIYAYVLITLFVFMNILYWWKKIIALKIIGCISIIFWVIWCITSIALCSSKLSDCIRQEDNISLLILASSATLPFAIVVLAVTHIHKILCANNILLPR